MKEVEAAGPGARSRPARASHSDQEEWRRAGFDLVLAQAMASRPFLSAAPGSPAPGPEAEARAGRSSDGEESHAGPPSGAETAGDRSRGTPGSDSGAAARDRGTGSAAGGRPADRRGAPPEAATPRESGAGESAPSVSAPVAGGSRPSPPPAARGGVEGGQAIQVGPRAAPPDAPSRQARAADTDAKPRPAPADPGAAAKRNESTASGSGRPVDVRFVFEDGSEGVLRVSVRGQAVRATIRMPDGPSAHRLEREAGELRRALSERGFRRSEVRIRPIAGPSATDGAGP